MFGVKSVPNGVSMGRPPAKVLPSRAVWQAIQSPARARYSPFTSSAASGVFCCAVAAVAPTNRYAATSAAEILIRVRDIGTLPSTRLAAAFKRHRKASARRERGVRRRRARGKESGNRLHVVFGEKAGHDLHAVRRGSGTRTIAPAAELSADIAGAQAEQAGDRRLHAAERRAVTGRTWRHAALRITVFDQRFAAGQNFVADSRDGRRRK